MTFLAKLASWLFLPLLIPVYALAIALYTPVYPADITQNNVLFIITDEAKYLLIYLFIALAFIGPSITLLIMLLRGTITSLMLENRKERMLPSVMVNLFALFLVIILYRMIPSDFTGISFLIGLALGSFLTVFACTLITLKWKISLHAAGMGILTGFVFSYFLAMSYFPIWIVPLCILLSGFVMSMRMFLNAHNLSQSLAGYGLGFVATFSALFFFNDLL